jgi:hypothetical protein
MTAMSAPYILKVRRVEGLEIPVVLLAQVVAPKAKGLITNCEYVAFHHV